MCAPEREHKKGQSKELLCPFFFSEGGELVDHLRAEDPEEFFGLGNRIFNGKQNKT